MNVNQREFEDIGKCEFWDSKPFIDAANILVAADEPMKALQLLTNLPGYYREHIPEEIKKVKTEIHSLLATPGFYLGNIYDQKVDLKRAIAGIESTMRGQLIHEEVKALNAKGIMPHIVDLGPGEYWLPIGLHHFGAMFTYCDIGLNPKAKELAMQFIHPVYREDTPKDRPTIFVACEIIEHLHNPYDILTDCLRKCPKPDIIHISTPKYTFDGRKERLNWRECGDLGHLRTFTPRDFVQLVTEMFLDYDFKLYDHLILHMRGELRK